jgi:hypothetical protein
MDSKGIDRTPCLLDLDAPKGYRLSAARRAGGRHLGNGQEKGTPTMVGWCLREVSLSVLMLSLLLASGARAVAADAAPTPASQPILRGIALVEGGQARAYLEDPRTGMVTAYGLGDTVGESRIERIQEDRVVLRRGDEVVQLLLGVPSTAMSSDASGSDSPPQRVAAPDVSATSGQSPPIQAERLDAPIIGSGQPWLDKLGIPRGALSQAIESAPPAEGSNNLDD